MNVSRRLSAIAVISVITAISFSLLSSMSMNNVFAGGYEKSQTTIQTNECGNYWFPLDILCSNLGSQTQGDENSISTASAQDNYDNAKSSESHSPPFP